MIRETVLGLYNKGYFIIQMNVIVGLFGLFVLHVLGIIGVIRIIRVTVLGLLAY